MCTTGKQAYASPAEAARVAKQVKRRAKPGGWHAGKLAHYRCPLCGEWHIGHDIPQGKRA